MASSGPLPRLATAFALSASLALTLPVANALAQMPVDLIDSLFYTPAQRRALDEQSQRPEYSDGQFAADNRPTRVPPENLTFNGSVRRSAGRSTGWIDGARLENPTHAVPGRALTLRGDRLLVEQNGRRATLKAGETLNRDPTLPTAPDEPAND